MRHALHAIAPFSFAIVIQQLPNPLRDAVCIFYLVLRALDTVEDDMALAVDIKLPALRVFYKSIYDRCPQQAGPWKGKQQQGQSSAWDTRLTVWVSCNLAAGPSQSSVGTTTTRC